MKELKKYYVCRCGSANNEDPIFTSNDLSSAVSSAQDEFESIKDGLRWHNIRINAEKDWVEVREVKSIDADGIDDYEVVFSYNPSFSNYYNLDCKYNALNGMNGTIECTAYVLGAEMDSYEVDCDPDYTIDELVEDVIVHLENVGVMKEESKNELKDMLKRNGIKEKLEEDDNAKKIN